jgi:cell division protein FtsB
MGIKDELDFLKKENDDLKHKIKDLEYDNAEHQVKDEVLWNAMDNEYKGIQKQE